MGPKLAIAILSGLDISKIIYAITNKNLKLLSSVPGVGKKTAERIVFDLKDKFNVKEISFEDTESVKLENKGEDIIAALTNLGYKPAEVKPVTENMLKLHPEEPIEQLIKLILNKLYNG